jgi:hypothetical protein
MTHTDEHHTKSLLFGVNFQSDSIACNYEQVRTT